jgi:uncharacterized membrane protein YdbT with pleckstrin-like domain
MTPWIQSNLSSNEKLLTVGKPHWIWFFSPGRVFFYVLTLGLALLYTYLQWLTHELAVTNKRVVMKTGILSRNVIEMKLGSVESVQVEQSIIGRMMNFGTIVVHGNGEDALTVERIADPWAVQRAANA